MSLLLSRVRTFGCRAREIMLLQRALWLSPKFAKFCCVLLLAYISVIEASVFCSREVFGRPRYRDCMQALSAVPTDKFVQFFVEQQLRTDFPGASWPQFVDPRPLGRQKKVVQVPKLWNYGKLAELPWH